MQEQNKNFNKEIETIRKEPYRNTATDKYNDRTEKFNREFQQKTLGHAEGRISELKDTSFEINQ